MNKTFIYASLNRALRTFCQTLVGMITVGAAWGEVDWLRALSVGATAAVLSLLTSVATGLPEAG